MRGELEALELALATLERAHRAAAAGFRAACPVAGAAARALGALPVPSGQADACYRTVELAAVSLLADDPGPARACPAPPGCDDWLEDVVSASARRLLAFAAREDGGRAAAAHDRLVGMQPEREPSWLARRSPSLEARRRAFSLFAAYGMSHAVVRLAAGDRDAAATLSDQALFAAERGFDVRLSVACTWVGAVARAAPRPADRPVRLAS